MPRLSHKQLAEGIINGNITRVTKTDAEKLLKALGFRDNSKEIRKGRSSSSMANRALYQHPDSTYDICIPRDNLLPPDYVRSVRLAIEEVITKNPTIFERYESGDITDAIRDSWAAEVRQPEEASKSSIHLT